MNSTAGIRYFDNWDYTYKLRGRNTDEKNYKHECKYVYNWFCKWYIQDDKIPKRYMDVIDIYNRKVIIIYSKHPRNSAVFFFT